MPIPNSFQTSRLEAERLSPNHLPDLMRLHQDAQAMAELGGVRDEAETSRYLTRNLDHWTEHGFGIWMLRETQGDHSIGRVVLRWLSTESVNDVEIGFALLPDYWGRGIATEAAQYCLDLARLDLDLKTLIGVTTAENRRSQRVLGKLGLRRDSELVVNGAPCVLHRIRW